jgi:hypothetical protein
MASGIVNTVVEALKRMMAYAIAHWPTMKEWLDLDKDGDLDTDDILGWMEKAEECVASAKAHFKDWKKWDTWEKMKQVVTWFQEITGVASDTVARLLVQIAYMVLRAKGKVK